MKEKRSSIDGFVARRPSSRLGGLHVATKRRQINTIAARSKSGSVVDMKRSMLGEARPGRSIGRSDIDESLREIDNVIKQPQKKLTRKQRRLMKKLARKPRSRAYRVVKRFFILLIVAAFVIGGFMAYKFIMASDGVFQGGILNLIQNQPLKQDSNGRSNFLILGTTEDDPTHPGSNLTDSMLIVSIDQKAKNMYMFSVPRDLYVEYGDACTSGYSGKINEYFSCSNDGTSAADEQDRLEKTQKFVGDIFGMDIQYGAHVNQTVLKQAVDAVGGIDVDVEGSNGDAGVLDRNFDWRCNYTCYLVKYTNGVHHLDGDHALYLSQARGDVAPTYGLGNSNFDREKNQQKILIALRDKAVSTGTITNLGTITKLIDAFGSNLRTNIQTAEIRTLMQVAGDMKSNTIHTISLIDDDNPVMGTGPYGGASVVMPTAGIFNYSDIQAYIAKKLSSNPIVREAAPIVVLNGSGESGVGQTKANALTAEGYNVTLVDTAPDGTYPAVEVYQIGSGNTETAAKLKSKYKVTIKKTAPPVVVSDDVRFVVVFGSSSSS